MSFGDLKPVWVQGYAGDDLIHVTPNVICYRSGNKIQLHDVHDKMPRMMESPGHGLDKITSLPDRGLFAFSECGENPTIFVCDYSNNNQIIMKLQGGALLEYQKMAFSSKRSYLVGVSGVPDYTVFVWDYSDGTLLCQAKIPDGEQIDSVAFNPVNTALFALQSDKNVFVFTIQRCNDLHQLDVKKVQLPVRSEDGGLVVESSETMQKERNYSYKFMKEASLAGLVGPPVDQFILPQYRANRLKPTGICWRDTGTLLIGGEHSHLIELTNELTFIRIVLGTAEDENREDCASGMFSRIKWSVKSGLVAGGSDGVVRLLDIQTPAVLIKQIYKTTHPIMHMSVAGSTIALATSDNLITFFPLPNDDDDDDDEVQQRTFVFHRGRFVAVDETAPDTIVTCRENGRVQVWRRGDGAVVGDLHIENTRLTVMACSPLAQGAIALGTDDGHLIMCHYHPTTHHIRVVHRIRLYRDPLTCIKFEGRGRYLMTSSKDDRNLYVLDGRATSNFACLGYVGLPRNCIKLALNSALSCNKSLVTCVLARPTAAEFAASLGPRHEYSGKEYSTRDSGSRESGSASGEEISGGKNDGTDVVVFNFTTQMVREPHKFFSTGRSDFNQSLLGMETFHICDEIEAAHVIRHVDDRLHLATISTIDRNYAEYEVERGIHDSLSVQVARELVRSSSNAHQLTGAHLRLSRDGRIAVSAAPDGYVVMRSVRDSNVSLGVKLHSYLCGGVSDVHLMSDASGCVSIGSHDFAMNFYQFSPSSAEVMVNLNEFQRRVDGAMEKMKSEESEALAHMQVYQPSSTQAPPDGSPQPPTGEERHNDDDDSDAVTMTPTPEPILDGTWLELRQAEWRQEDNSKFDEHKRRLRKNIKKLRKTVLSLRDLNAGKDELERLALDEFNLDKEQLKRMRSEQEERLQQVRREGRFDNLKQRYLAHHIRLRCWEHMDTKGRSLRPFVRGFLVSNYPMKDVPASEAKQLKDVMQKRKLEMLADEICEKVEEEFKKGVVEEEEEEVEEKGGVEGLDEMDEGPVDEEEMRMKEIHRTLSLHGSLAPTVTKDNSGFYSQLDLHNRESKVTQIILIKEAIRKVKTEFNREFGQVYKSKEADEAKINERNARIRYIMSYLGLTQPVIIDEEMNDFERPERCLQVLDHEVPVERVLSEEQQREKEERERRLEQLRLEALGDNRRARGLKEMMDGVLQVKREDILAIDVPVPDFLRDGKDEDDWTAEDLAAKAEYEEACALLEQERAAFRKQMEGEMKKLIALNSDARNTFDDNLSALFEKKVKAELMVFQEELKIVRLLDSILEGDEQTTHKAHIDYLCALVSKIMVQKREESEEAEMRVEAYHNLLDTAVAEDKMLERAFKREFPDQSAVVIEQLFKYFKRRPKGVRAGATASTINFAKSSSRPPELIQPDQRVINEMDLNRPDDVDDDVWQRMCRVRRVKIASEYKIRKHQLVLMEMRFFSEGRKQHFDRTAAIMDRMLQLRNKLCSERMKSSLNLNVQFLLKQGQVEVTPTDFIAEFDQSILLDRTIVEKLNTTINSLGASKIATMVERKDFKKGIHTLEWERRKMIMQMEDLQAKAKYIQQLKLTRGLQEYLNEEDYEGKQSKLIQQQEATHAAQEKEKQKKLKRIDGNIEDLNKSIRTKDNENKELDRVIEELVLTCSEHRNIHNINGGGERSGEMSRRMRRVVQRRRLVELAKAQAQEVAVLRAEVERLRMKTFPALVQLEH